MSQTIWMRCGGLANAAPLATKVFCVVEGQYPSSTRKLVDNDDEQAVLEDMIDGVKPPLPSSPGFSGLHFLLKTPFRHSPLRGGTRFGARRERGIFYAADEASTALAEWAYYRFVLLEGTNADLGTTISQVTTFRASIAAIRAIDLTKSPFAAHKAQLSAPGTYAHSQPFGSEMRAAGVEAFAFFSARVVGKVNFGLFEPCFRDSNPHELEGWRCAFRKDLVEYRKNDVFRRVNLSFPRSDFQIDGKLPIPAMNRN